MRNDVDLLINGCAPLLLQALHLPQQWCGEMTKNRDHVVSFEKRRALVQKLETAGFPRLFRFKTCEELDFLTFCF